MRSAPRIPVGDEAVGVEHEDGVVGHSLNQHPEPLFGAPQPGEGFGHLPRALLDALLELVVELPLRLLGCLAVADIDQHVYAADQRAGRIVQRGRERDEMDARAVRPFRDRLDAADRPVFLQGDRHRAFVMPHRRPVRPVQTPADAPMIAAQFRSAPGELDRGLVVKRQAAPCIGRVYGGRQCFEELSKSPIERRVIDRRGWCTVLEKIQRHTLPNGGRELGAEQRPTDLPGQGNVPPEINHGETPGFPQSP